MKRIAALGCLLFGGILCAQNPSPYNNVTYQPVTATATSQTKTINLGNGARSNSWTSGNIVVTGSSLTTATFAVNCSSDGVSYNALAINVLGTPGTTATTETATSSPTTYQVYLTGCNYVQIVTSGTFTATSVTFTLTASPNGLIGRAGGGGSGNCPTSGSGAGVVQASNGSGACENTSITDNGTTVVSTEPNQASSYTATGPVGFIAPTGTQATATAGEAIYQQDGTTGYAEVSENGAAKSRVCTAANGICPLAPTTVVSTSGSPYSLAGATGFYWNNTASTYNWVLDAPTAGKQYCFGNYSARTGALTITSTTSVYIVYKGSNGTVTTGTLVSGGAAGDFVCMVGVDSTHYMVAGAGYGTWTNN